MGRDEIRRVVDEAFDQVKDQIVDGVYEVLGNLVQDAFKPQLKHKGRKPAKKTKRTNTKPCPVPDCNGTGAPRYGMFCKEHSTLEDEEKEILRFRAKKPGGKWHKDTAKQKKAGAA